MLELVHPWVVRGRTTWEWVLLHGLESRDLRHCSLAEVCGVDLLGVDDVVVMDVELVVHIHDANFPAAGVRRIGAAFHGRASRTGKFAAAGRHSPAHSVVHRLRATWCILSTRIRVEVSSRSLPVVLLLLLHH